MAEIFKTMTYNTFLESGVFGPFCKLQPAAMFW